MRELLQFPSNPVHGRVEAAVVGQVEFEGAA